MNEIIFTEKEKDLIDRMKINLSKPVSKMNEREYEKVSIEILTNLGYDTPEKRVIYHKEKEMEQKQVKIHTLLPITMTGTPDQNIIQLLDMISNYETFINSQGLWERFEDSLK